jgi:NAD(P)-dependent dehydrogenase (short-subunit alcohol dehydrogenase family)
MSALEGRRILVAGASVGIGRVVGQYLCGEGAHVAFAARRGALCEEVASEVQGTAIGITCDVTDESKCEQAMAETAARLGGLDDVVYAAGLISIVALAQADADSWRRTLEINVMGAALVTKAALPYLQRSGGTSVYLSSVSSAGAPWPGIGVYTASKAALNRMIETWRSEHPELGFARVSVGPTAGGSNTSEFDLSARPHAARWAAMGVHSGAMVEPESVARAVALILAEPARIWEISLYPRDGALPWPGA